MSKTARIADLHCDLLCYLANDAKRSVHDDASNCSLAQLRAGGVWLQVMAIFTDPGNGGDTVASGMRQAEIFALLENQHPQGFRRVRGLRDLQRATQCEGVTHIIAAVENATGFFADSEPLADGIRRFRHWASVAGPFLYMSLTWNNENRFGGGNATQTGLKDDGRRLLNLLAELNIAVDFSHTSDALAHDILSYIDTQRLPLQVLASHSNFRSVQAHARNLPDEIAREILRRDGVIGLNLLAPFVGGDEPMALLKQVEHAMRLEAHRKYVFGADFFHINDVPAIYRRSGKNAYFFEGFGNASVYPQIRRMLLDSGMGEAQCEQIGWKNAVAFIERLWCSI